MSHVSEFVLKSIKQIMRNINLIQKCQCEFCVITRLRVKSHKNTSKWEKYAFEMFHLNVKEFYNIKRYDNSVYVDFALDDFIQKYWVSTFAIKNEFIDSFLKLCCHHITFECFLHSLRLDQERKNIFNKIKLLVHNWDVVLKIIDID